MNAGAEQLRNVVAPWDIAFVISGSRNSPNILPALEVAWTPVHSTSD
jgi:hypothetical protein